MKGKDIRAAQSLTTSRYSEKRIQRLGLAGVSAIALCWALPAFAQAEAIKATAATESGNGEQGLSDIIVTAQRRSEPLQRAAIAASAVTGEALTKGSITQAAQLADLVPAIKVTPVGGTGTNIYLRGVGTTAVSSFSDLVVGINLDNVYMGRASGISGLFYDLDRIEVLKGPQGTLYGRNATGGVLNIITKKAALDAVTGMGSIEYGNYDSKKVQAAINLPLGPTLAVRASGQYVSRDGYFSNGYDDENGYGVRLNMLWQPSDMFHIDFSSDYGHQGGKGGGAVLFPAASGDAVTPPISARVEAATAESIAALTARSGPLVPARIVVPPQNDGYIDSEAYGVSATAVADLGFGALTFVPAYRVIKPNFLSYRSGFYALNVEEAKQTSFEIRFSSSTDKAFQYIVGAYYYKQNQTFTNTYIQGATVGSSIVGAADSESYAFFGQARYALTDSFRLVGGMRYTHDYKDRNGQVVNPFPVRPTTIVAPFSNTANFNNLSYRVSAEFEPSTRSLFYASIATGYKAGGFDTGVGSTAFRPEKLTAFTAGTKNRFMNNRLQANLELFYWKYRDQQISYVGPVQLSPGVFGLGGIVSNIGQARMYGADLDFRFLLTPADNLSVNMQYLNTKYTSFSYLALSPNGASPVNGCALLPDSSLPIAAPGKLFRVDCGGRAALNAPEWTAIISYDHTFELSGEYALVAQVGTRLESSRYLNIEYVSEEQQGGFRKSNASLTLNAPGKKWSLSAFVQNIEDRTTKNQATVRPIADVVYVGLEPPRTYGIRFSFNF